MTGIGNQVDNPLSDRILLALLNAPFQPTTKALATFVGIASATPERAEFNEELTRLRERRLIAFEMAPNCVWRLKPPGYVVARKIERDMTSSHR